MFLGWMAIVSVADEGLLSETLQNKNQRRGAEQGAGAFFDCFRAAVLCHLQLAVLFIGCLFIYLIYYHSSRLPAHVP